MCIYLYYLHDQNSFNLKPVTFWFLTNLWMKTYKQSHLICQLIETWLINKVYFLDKSITSSTTDCSLTALNAHSLEFQIFVIMSEFP